MTNFFSTVILAIIVIAGALALLGVSYLVTGKSSLRPGACGRLPEKRRPDGQRDEHCGTDMSCPLCKPDDDEEKKK